MHGWPAQNSEHILNLDERFSDGITFRSEDYRGTSLIGGDLYVGQHVTYLIAELGYDNSTTYGILLNVFSDYVRALWQTGEAVIWLRNDWKISSGQRVYSVGDPVWYDIYPLGESKKEGTLTGLTGISSTETTTFDVQDNTTGVTLTLPATAVIYRCGVPGTSEDYDSRYNTHPIV